MNSRSTWLIALIFFAQLVLIFSPGPIYFVVLLLIIFLAILFITKDITISSFFVYLLLLFNNAPFFEHTTKSAIPLSFYFQKVRLYSVYESIQIRDILVVIACVSILFNSHIPLRKLTKRNASLRHIFYIFIVLLFNQLFGNYSTSTWFSFLSLVSLFLAYVVVRASIKINASMTIHIVRATVVASLLTQVIAAGIQLFQSLVIKSTQIPLGTYSSILPQLTDGRISGTFSHPNYLAVNIGIVCAFFASELFSVGINKQKNHLSTVLHICILCVGTTLVALSRSRIAFFSLLLIYGFLVVKFLIAGREKSKTRFLQIIQSKLLPLFAGMTILLFLYTFNRSGGLTTLEGRWATITQGIDIIAKKPLFGVGPELSTYSIATHYHYVFEYEDSLRGIHSTWLLFAAENGIVVTLLIVLLYIKLGRTLKKSQNARSSIAMTALIFFVICSLFYPLYIYDGSIELLFILIGISVMARKNYNHVK